MERSMTHPQAPHPIGSVATAPARAAGSALGSEGKVEESTVLRCNIAEANAFSCEYNQPALPVLAVFGGGRLHQWRRTGSFRLDQAVEENGDALIRSYRDQSSADFADRWCELLFQFGPRAFLHTNDRRIVGYASTPGEAERLVTEFSTKFGVEKEFAGSFQLINTSRFRADDTESVFLEPSATLSDEMLDLHYGGGFAEWHREFCRDLRNSKYGLSIFAGPPGTGKTSYLRHLAGTLKDSHRFYFLPPSRIGILSDSAFLDIWSAQRRAHPRHRFVVFLEDAEAALLTRGNDNREQLSAVLSLSDGFLGDFLRLQIICTINCTVAEIDPALLRPGRLLAHRVFPRLSYADAERLAESLGRALPEPHDYSLAEVFAGTCSAEWGGQRIGFAG